MYYFDYASTTPCDVRVVNKINEYHLQNFGNASSRSHEFGWIAEQGVEDARKIIADFINVESNEIFFTSGATEATNLAIQGFVKGPSFNGKKIAATITEHKCAIETLRFIEREGIAIEFLKVDQDGLIDLEYLKDHINEFSLLSISYVNNETGVMQDLDYISRLCRDNGVFLHVDAAQAYGKIRIDARKFDLMSISAHKIYGPKGIGALFISKKPRVRVQPLLYGGGQERGVRAGTVASPLCVGFGEATKIAAISLEQDYKNAELFQQKFYEEFVDSESLKYIDIAKVNQEKVNSSSGILKNNEINSEIRLNGSIKSKSPYIVNLTIPYIEGESLMMRLKDFALSSGSACTSKTLEPSYVIAAMYPNSPELAHSSLRISYGRGITTHMIELLVESLKKHIKELRELSPLWAMKCKGIDLNTIKFG